MAEASSGKRENTKLKDRKVRNSRLPSMSSIMEQTKEYLGDVVQRPKKRRRKNRCQEFEFSTDPVTGIRCNKGTYDPDKRSKQRVDTDESCAFDGATANEEEQCGNACVDTQKSDEMKDILKSAEEMLAGWKNGAAQASQTWHDRDAALHGSWAESRSALYEATLKACVPPKSQLCSRCQLEADSLVYCNECSPNRLLCCSCDEEIHSNLVFHDRKAITDGHYYPIAPTTSRSNTGEWITVARSLPPSDIWCPYCNSRCSPESPLPQTRCIVVNMRGRFDINHRGFKCHSCGQHLSTSLPVIVIQLGFWPGSISDMTYVFDQEMFMYWDILQKKIPGISECAFIKSLELFSRQKGRVSTINPTTFRMAFREWKFCQFEMNKERHIDWMECPACFDHQHSVHVDGNMKLYRFKSAGMRKRDCYYEETFTASNKKVDSHIQKLYQTTHHTKKSEADGKCGDSNWRAADNHLRKKKNLDETGLEIAGCRHGLAQHAINMMYGEVYAYAHYLQTNHFIPKKVEFLWYDIVCMYWPWLQKHDKENYSKMKPALSVMHAKAHAWHCQAIWGGRWQKGAAATTGEEVEQINSHFSRLGCSTKHMLPEGREELLTEHALHWNRKKVEGLPHSLASRYKKAELQIKKFKGELQKQLEGIDSNKWSAENWKNDVLLVAKAEVGRQKPQLTEDEKNYLSHLKSIECSEMTQKQKTLCDVGAEMYRGRLSDCKGDDRKDIEKGETILTKAKLFLEKKMESYHYSISQIVFNMAKLADGSKQRTRLRKKITTEKGKLERAVAQYNSFENSNHVQLDDVEQGMFPWNACDIQKEDIPVRKKRLVVDKAMEIERFEEELGVLQKEMLSFMHFYKDNKLQSLNKEQERLHNLLKGSEEDYPTESKDFRYVSVSTERQVLLGKLALIDDGIDFAMRQIATGIAAFAPLLSAGHLNECRQFILVQQLEDVGDDDGKEYIDDEFVDSDAESDILESDCILDGSASKSNDVINNSIEVLKPVSLNVCPPVTVEPGIVCWTLPEEVSQGSYKGRNGSNACSIIAVLIGYIMKKRKLSIPNCDSPLTNTFLRALCGCIELGNRIYDLCRHSLPARYLSIQEAATVLGMWMSCSVDNALPVRLQDQHTPSTIAYQLEHAISADPRAAFIIINEKSSVFYLTTDSVMYVDTHKHPPRDGPVVVTASVQRLDQFCRTIWHLEGNSEHTFGNVVFVDF